ncbi:putative F-box protein [Raphanus sativus]|nr:putative F-box protein [Raphanus sativus]
MITRSKKNKTTVTINPQASSYDVLPLDLVMEIIGRLPVKSIARFLLVSKLWATTIRSRDFIKSFPLGSCNSSQPRFLIASNGRYGKERYFEWYFFSSSFLSRSSCPLPYHVYRAHYVNGLVCTGYGQEQFIVNPTTGKSIALPRVRTRRKVAISFFGYDSVSDEYKVLCMTEAQRGPNFQGPSSEHQVFTLGAKKRSWRMVECSIDHRPWSSGVCIDGFIYYCAETDKSVSQHSVMRFDLRSEKFHRITGVPTETVLSEEAQYSYVVILNYQGKVAIPTQTSRYTFDVWVMDQDAEEHKWLKKLTFSVEPWKSLFDFISIQGITLMGEFILAPYGYSPHSYVVLYNHYIGKFSKIKVNGNPGCSYTRYPGGIFFSDYIESVRFL